MANFKLCNEYVAFLRALYLIHQNSHWLTSGPEFYGNHLLFERLYESAQKNADLAAEKFIGLFGNKSLDVKAQAILIAKLLVKYTPNDEQSNNKWVATAKASLDSEQEFLQLSESFYKELKESEDMTLGLDDMIMSISSDRETAVYLLNQIMGDNVKPKFSNLVQKFEKKLAQQKDIEKEVGESIFGPGQVPTEFAPGDPLDPTIKRDPSIPGPGIPPRPKQTVEKPIEKKPELPPELKAALDKGAPGLKGMIKISFLGPTSLDIAYDTNRVARIGLKNLREVERVLKNALFPKYTIEKILGYSSPEWVPNYY